MRPAAGHTIPVVTIQDPIHLWLADALADAERRGLPELKPLLENLARATGQLRRADWNEEASGQSRIPDVTGRA